MQFARENVPYNLDDSEMNRTVPAKSFFPSFPVFQLGNKDLKPRTGSWRVVQILATINLAAWIGVAILFWLGLSSLNNRWIVFPPVSLLVITLAYPNLYVIRQRKRNQTSQNPQ